MNLDVMYSKQSDHWKTPTTLMNKLRFDLDVCPYHSTIDYLNKDWGKNTICYCNPPYSKISLWVDKIIEQVIKNNVGVKLLIPARTDTKYFQKLINNVCCDIIFLKGRLKFNDVGCAPFPSLLIYINEDASGKFYTIDYREVTNL